MHSLVPETNQTGSKTDRELSKSPIAYPGAALDRARQLGYQLRHLCAGRESHASLVSLRAISMPDGRSVFLWRDDFTAESGRLGYAEAAEVDVVVRSLFSWLRRWRSHARAQAPAEPKAMAAGVGGRR